MGTTNLERITFEPDLNSDLWVDFDTHEVFIVTDNNKTPVELRGIKENNDIVDHDSILFALQLMSCEIWSGYVEFNNDSEHTIKPVELQIKFI